MIRQSDYVSQKRHRMLIFAFYGVFCFGRVFTPLTLKSFSERKYERTVTMFRSHYCEQIENRVLCIVCANVGKEYRMF